VEDAEDGEGRAKIFLKLVREYQLWKAR
jgi:hypothetical protein